MSLAAYEREAPFRRPKNPALYVLRPGDPRYPLHVGQVFYHGGAKPYPVLKPGGYLSPGPNKHFARYEFSYNKEGEFRSKRRDKGYISRYVVKRLPQQLIDKHTYRPVNYHGGNAIRAFLHDEGWDVPPANTYWSEALVKLAPPGIDGWWVYGELMLLKPMDFLTYKGAYVVRPTRLEGLSSRPQQPPSAWWLLLLLPPLLARP